MTRTVFDLHRFATGDELEVCLTTGTHLLGRLAKAGCELVTLEQLRFTNGSVLPESTMNFRYSDIGSANRAQQLADT